MPQNGDLTCVPNTIMMPPYWLPSYPLSLVSSVEISYFSSFTKNNFHPAIFLTTEVIRRRKLVSWNFLDGQLEKNNSTEILPTTPTAQHFGTEQPHYIHTHKKSSGTFSILPKVPHHRNIEASISAPIHLNGNIFQCIDI